MRSFASSLRTRLPRATGAFSFFDTHRMRPLLRRQMEKKHDELEERHVSLQTEHHALRRQHELLVQDVMTLKSSFEASQSFDGGLFGRMFGGGTGSPTRRRMSRSDSPNSGPRRPSESFLRRRSSNKLSPEATVLEGAKVGQRAAKTSNAPAGAEESDQAKAAPQKRRSSFRMRRPSYVENDDEVVHIV